MSLDNIIRILGVIAGLFFLLQGFFHLNIVPVGDFAGFVLGGLAFSLQSVGLLLFFVVAIAIILDVFVKPLREKAHSFFMVFGVSRFLSFVQLAVTIPIAFILAFLFAIAFSRTEFSNFLCGWYIILNAIGILGVWKKSPKQTEKKQE
ncbi:MAG TPA: hypothetical protein VI977_04910 [archaeon]|nr:hypothetical protein [archaeon]